MSKNFLDMEMEPKHLFRSISGFKYQLHEALGDLADNSVDARCKQIWITINKNEIVIADDGNGMTFEQFKKAITPWATNEGKHRSGQRGRYGIGLKSASFSLGRLLEIHTKSESGDFFLIKLDHDELIQKESKQFEYTTTETDLFKSYKLRHGTVIKIKHINTRKVTQPAIDKLKNEIGLMFFRLIEKNTVRIMINDQRVDPLHPLLIDLRKGCNPKFSVQKKGDTISRSGGDPGNYYHDYQEKQIDFEKENGKKVKIKIHAVHIGRGNHWSNSERNKYRYFLKNKVNADNEHNGLLKLDDQGIYIMRSDRLITLGGWFGIHRLNTLLHHDVACRVILEYDSEDDDVIGVDHTKTKPDLISALKDAIRDQYLSKVLTDSETRFRDEGQILLDKKQRKTASLEIQSRPKSSSLWGKKAAADNKVKRDADPEIEKREMALAEELNDSGSNKSEWFEIVDRLPGKVLWKGQKNKEGAVLLRLAEGHPAYSGFYHEEDRNKLRMNLNLLFYFMASFEVDVENLISGLTPSDKELLSKAFEEFRKFVSNQMNDFGEN